MLARARAATARTRWPQPACASSASSRCRARRRAAGAAARPARRRRGQLARRRKRARDPRLPAGARAVVVGADVAPRGVARIEHYSIYRPGARVAGSGRESGHARGLAIDAARFYLQNGSVLDVLTDWEERDHGGSPCPRRPEEAWQSRLLRGIVCDAVDQQLFPDRDHAASRPRARQSRAPREKTGSELDVCTLAIARSAIRSRRVHACPRHTPVRDETQTIGGHRGRCRRSAPAFIGQRASEP